VIELLLVQKKLVEVIQARASNIGNGNLYVATLLNPIPLVEVTKFINMNSFKKTLTPFRRTLTSVSNSNSFPQDFNECSEPEYNDCGENRKDNKRIFAKFNTASPFIPPPSKKTVSV